MKALPAFLILLFFSAAAPAEELKLPSGVYKHAQLNAAIDEAAKEKKPLFIVYGNSSPGDKEETETHLDAVKAGKNWAVTVFVNHKEMLEMPPPVLTAVQFVAGVAPTVIIASPEGDKVWKVIGRQEAATRREAGNQVEAGIKACRAEIAAWFSARPGRGPEMPGDTPLVWKVAGQENQRAGIFGKVVNGGLYFKGSDESGPADIPVANLSAAAQRYVKYISSGMAAKGGLETWTNAQGKTMEAAFVSLVNGEVTLRTAAGTEHTLRLGTLSAESQKRAKELGKGGVKK